MTTNLSVRIKELRKSQGLTQVELGVKLHKAGSTVRMWELGKSYPDAETLVVLAQVFNVSTDYLLSGDAAPDTLPEITRLTEPTLKDKQISKINKELAHLNSRQLKLVSELVREISHKDNQ